MNAAIRSRDPPAREGAREQPLARLHDLLAEGGLVLVALAEAASPAPRELVRELRQAGVSVYVTHGWAGCLRVAVATGPKARLLAAHLATLILRFQLPRLTVLLAAVPTRTALAIPPSRARSSLCSRQAKDRLIRPESTESVPPNHIRSLWSK